MSDSIEDLVKRAKEKSNTFDDKKEEELKAAQNEEEEILKKDETFEKLGVCPEICEAVMKMGYKHPSKIQAESLPYTLKGKDIIGLAETGSGKTAAFAIPVIQKLLSDP